MKLDFDKLKTEISLPDFLRDHYGFIFVEGTSRNYPKMKSPDGDVIVISKNFKGHYTYFDVHNDDVKGASIFDFLQSYFLKKEGTHLNLFQIGEILQEFIDKGQTVLPKNSVYSLSNNLLDGNSILTLFKNAKTLFDYSFLDKRGFDRAIFETKEWKGVFFQREFKSESGDYINTCVKLHNVGGLVGISQRNEHFKGVLGSRFDAVAHSIPDRTKFIDKIHLVESILDGAAHFQMNYFNKNDDLNVLYISSEGGLTEGHIGTIQQFIDRNKVGKIELNFDNDFAGALYSLKVAGGIKGDSNEIYFTTNKVQKKSNEQRVYLSVDIVAENILESKMFLAKYFPDSLFSKYLDLHNIDKNFVCQNEREYKYFISFPASAVVVQSLTEHICSMKFDKKIELVIPISKDFNEDLINKQNGRKSIEYEF